MDAPVSRRGFLQGAAAATAALFVGFDPRGGLAAADSAAQFNPFVRVSADGTVTVIVKHFEMGQGTTTGLTTLVAEELDAAWEQVEVEFAPADPPVYQNLYFKAQGTGGSTSIANSFQQYRQAGAAARDLLVRAAARTWNVSEDQVTVEDGRIRSGDRSAHFGEMIGVAATLTPAQEAFLKDPKDFKLIGKVDLPRKDSASKVDGSAVFAMDIKVPGTVYVAIKRSPKFGGKLRSFDLGEAKGMAGFLDAKALPNGAGVAVYAENTWAAFQARDAIAAEWDFSAAETRSTDQMIADHRKLLDTPQLDARPLVPAPQAAAAVDGAARLVEAEFILPFLAHAPMETLNCVVEPTETGVRVHDGCQLPSVSQPSVAGVLKLKPEQVEINTVYAGGSFGRRGNPHGDYHVEAAMAFALLGGKTPVKLVWSREDDLAGGYYRSMAAHRLRIGLDGDGRIAGWEHRIACASIAKGTPFETAMIHDGVDHTSIEGVADTPYGIPNLSVGLSNFETAVPVLWWRSVGHTHTAFAMESAVDMAAQAAGKDPVAYRMDLLSGGSADQKRLAAVLELAAEKADWGTSVAAGRGRGVAVHKSFNSYVAVVAEVAADGDEIKVERLTCAVDCGLAVNPDVVKAQMEGGIGYALGTAMRNKITFRDGEVEQANLPDYELLRLGDLPDVAVHIVPSAENPTGVGEPGVPPTAPAVANAIFAATGRRITDLPFTDAGLDFA